MADELTEDKFGNTLLNGVIVQNADGVPVDNTYGVPVKRSPANGVSETDMNSDEFAALGGLGNVQDSLNAVKAVMGEKKDPDLALASLLYFAEMGKQASKPGATLLGSAAGAATAPAAYLMQESKAERDRQAKVGPLALQLAATLGKQKKTASKAYTSDKSIPGVVNAGESVRLTEKALQALPQNEQNQLFETPKKKDKGGGSVPERRQESIFNVLEKIVGKVELSTYEVIEALANAETLQKDRFVPYTMPDGTTATVKMPGTDIFKIAEQVYGKNVVDQLRNFGENLKTDAPVSDDAPAPAPAPVSDDAPAPAPVSDDAPENVKIGGKNYEIFSIAQKSIPKEAASGIVNARAGISEMNTAYSIFFPKGKYDNSIALASAAPDIATGIASRVFDNKISSRSRTAKQSMKRAIEVILRARSGAAVPPSEVENYMSLYYPEALDNERQAKDKLDRLSDYFSESLTLLSQGKVDTKLGNKFRDLNVGAGNKSEQTQGSAKDLGTTDLGSGFVRLPNGQIAVKKTK